MQKSYFVIALAFLVLNAYAFDPRNAVVGKKSNRVNLLSKAVGARMLSASSLGLQQSFDPSSNQLIQQRLSNPSLPINNQPASLSSSSSSSFQTQSDSQFVPIKRINTPSVIEQLSQQPSSSGSSSGSFNSQFSSQQGKSSSPSIAQFQNLEFVPIQTQPQQNTKQQFETVQSFQQPISQQFDTMQSFQQPAPQQTQQVKKFESMQSFQQPAQQQQTQQFDSFQSFQQPATQQSTQQQQQSQLSKPTQPQLQTMFSVQNGVLQEIKITTTQAPLLTLPSEKQTFTQQQQPQFIPQPSTSFSSKSSFGNNQQDQQFTPPDQRQLEQQLLQQKLLADQLQKQLEKVQIQNQLNRLPGGSVNNFDSTQTQKQQTFGQQTLELPQTNQFSFQQTKPQQQQQQQQQQIFQTQTFGNTDDFCRNTNPGDLVPHPRIPSQFIICYGFTEPTIMECPEHLVFNQHLQRCDLHSDEPLLCKSNPCQNNGKCVQLAFDFKCECPTGFSGQICERVDSCSGRPCGAEGQCMSLQHGSPVSHVCMCNGGRSFGSSCDSAEANPCLAPNSNLKMFPTRLGSTMFAHCEGSRPHFKFCNPPLVFNAAKQACDWM